MPEDPAHTSPPPPEPGRPWWRRLGRGVGIGLASLVALVLGVLLTVQTPWGADKVTRLALGAFNPFRGAALTFEHIDGNFVSHLTLNGVRLVADDGTTLARIDTVSARYNLLALFKLRLHLKAVHIDGLEATMTQQADSSWDLVNAFPVPDTLENKLLVLIDTLRLGQGRAEMHFYAPGSDSTAYAEDLTLRLRDFRKRNTLALALDTLYGQVQFPGAPEPLVLNAGASYDDGRFTLRGLRMTSAYSDVAGAGTLLLTPDAATAFDEARFRLQAHPLAFRDLNPFIPTLDPATTLDLDVSVKGSNREVEAIVRAVLSDSGEVRIEFEGTPTATGPLVYRADGSVRNLRPASLGMDAVGLFNTDFRVNLYGPALDRLDGRLNVTVFDTHLGDYAPGRTLLEATFADGEAAFSLETSLRGAALTAAGTTRPFDEEPSYTLKGDLLHFDLGRFSADGAQQSDLNTAFTLAGIGRAPQTADLYLTLQLSPSTLNTVRLSGGQIRTELAEGRFAFDAALALERGRIAAEGELRMGDTPTYTLRGGRIEQVPIAALLGDTTASILNGTFAFEGRGTDPAAMRLEGQVELYDTVYGPYTLEAADLRPRLVRGLLTLTADARLDGGRLAFEASGRPFEATPTYTLTDGAFEHVDLAAFLPDLGWTSDLNGRIAATVRGFEPATMDLEGRLELDASRLNAQDLEGAALEADLGGGLLEYDLRLALPEGRTALSGTTRPFDEVPTYTLAEGTLDALNVGALLGLPGWQTDLNASLTLDGQGFDPGTMRLRARLALAPSTINEATFEDGRLEANLAEGLVLVDARFGLDQGRVELDAEGRFFDDRPRYKLRGQLDNLDLARLLMNDSLATGGGLSFELEGEGLEPRTMQIEGQVRARAFRYNTLRADTAYAAFTLRDGLARIDSLEVRSNVGTLSARGPVALYDSLGDRTSDLAFDLRVTSVAPLRPLLGGAALALQAGTFTGRLFGQPGTLRFNTHATLDGLAYNDIRVVRFSGRFIGEFDRERILQQAELQATVDAFSVPTLTLEETEVEASYTPGALVFETNIRIDSRRRGRLAGRAQLSDSSQVFTLQTLNLRLDSDAWALLQPATLTMDGAYRISNLLLYTGNQQIALDGILDPNGTQNLILTIEQLRIAAVADLFGYPDVGGTLTGYLDLTGPAAAPQMSGLLDLNLNAFGTEVGDISTSVAYDDNLLHLDARMVHTAEDTLLLQGVLPFNLTLAETPAERLLSDDGLSLTLTADHFDISWARAFIDPILVDRLQGELTADITLGGARSSPLLDGTASLANGELGLPKLGREHGLVYRDLQAALTFEGDVVRVERIEMHSGRNEDGTFVAEGTVALSDLTLGEFNITANASNFLAIDSREYRGVMGADLRLSGSTRRPLLSGNVNVRQADIYLTEENTSEKLALVRLTEADQRALERHFGIRVTESDTTTFDFYEALTIENLHVVLQRDTWVRSKKNPTMDIQFTGDLDVRKQPHADVEVFGSIDVLPERSRLVQFGKQFAISRGNLTFNGPAIDPIMDIEAHYTVRARSAREEEVTINLTLSGRLTDPDPLTLDSDPAMELTDIVSYLAFGRPASETLQLGGSGGTSAFLDPALGLAVSRLTNYIETVAGSSLGLDVFQFNNDAEGLKVTAGKYVRPRLYLAIVQPVSGGSSLVSAGTGEAGTGIATTFILEYEVFEELLLRLQSGVVFRVNLQWEHAY